MKKVFMMIVISMTATACVGVVIGFTQSVYFASENKSQKESFDRADSVVEDYRNIVNARVAANKIIIDSLKKELAKQKQLIR